MVLCLQVFTRTHNAKRQTANKQLQEAVMSKRKISILILVLLMVALVAFTFVSCSKKTMELTVTDVKAVYDGAAHAVEVSCDTGDTSYQRDIALLSQIL